MLLLLRKKNILLLIFFCFHFVKGQKTEQPFYHSKDFSVFADRIVQNKFTARAVSATEIISNYQSGGDKVLRDKTDQSWVLSKSLNAFPQYHSDYSISDAIYNLSLEEMEKAVEKDSTFRTGKEWGGVWTRDISYSIILSMAYLQPKVAMNSLLRKVNKKKRIIQDTGTGGAYPCSTDRIIWAVAAWELYKVTGDRDWLQQAYIIIKNSVDDDLQNIYDQQTGLVKGESSFLDWREETYPAWMQPADIYESECLGTNAVHYQANMILSDMASLLNKNDEAAKYKNVAEKIKEGINKYLWMPEKNYYAQYLYGRNYKLISPRSEALGEALCILFGIAGNEKAVRIISNTPLTSFGISCIYPQIPGIPPYHNNAIWPFVQTFWLWAAAKAGNEKAVVESIADIYRPAALFLTNKENMVADNGDYNGTQINSSVMLWSLSGNISIVHKVLFGLHFDEDKLSFKPFVPLSMPGKKTLNNFKYRLAVLNIEMEGTGNQIKTFLIDGKPTNTFSVPVTLTGNHDIRIILADNKMSNETINRVANYTSVETPQLSFENDTLKWNNIEGAKSYRLIENGKQVESTTKNNYIVKENGNNEFTVIAVDSNKVESFAAEPLNYNKNSSPQIFEIETTTKPASYNYKGFSGTGFVETSTFVNQIVTVPVEVTETGLYVVNIKYANGNGPVNTENKCAIRTLKVDAKKTGTFVFPQRGTNEWSNWGYSNAVQTHLTKGKHILLISLETFNDNMNGEVNAAMLDFLVLTRLDK
jgi:alpha-L-rhamnosidase-like protein